MQRPLTTPGRPKDAVGLAVLGLLAGLVTLSCSKNPPRTEQTPRQPAIELAQSEPVLSEPQFSEALLELRVRAALLERLRADALGIEVDLDGDTVTLRGVVGEEEWRRLALETARSVIGVGKVENRLLLGELVQGSSRDRMTAKLDREASDALLEIRLRARLVEELGRVGFNIYVDVTGGTVSLRGRVPDADQRQRAARVAKRLSGVEEVFNYLTLHA